ncbi:MAG: hypothetical protein ACR2HN_10320 [Tepidiformaceae bacterium]
MREFRKRYVASGRFAGRPEAVCATPEGLVYLKLFALPSLSRRGENARAALYETDIRLLLSAHDIDTDSLLAVLQTDMLASDVSVLRGLVLETRSRIGENRFAPGPSVVPPG